MTWTPLSVEDLVGLRGRGRVRALEQDLGVEQVGVVGVDHAAERGGDEDVALEREQLLGRDRLDARAVELGQLAAAADVRLQRLGVEPVLGVDRAVGVGGGDDGAAELGHDARGPRADVAEALDDDARVGGLQAERGRGLAEHVDEPAAGRRLAAVGALERDRLAGHDRRRVAVQLAVLVHHPGHRLRVGADVGRRDVALRAEHLLDLVDERARDLLQLGLGHAVASTLTPPLAPPNGMSATAVFQVISVASARTSSRSTSGW